MQLAVLQAGAWGATGWHLCKPLCDDIVAWTRPVHVPMSLLARTAAQGESSSTHVPMSLIGRGPLCKRIVWKDLEWTGNIRKVLEVSRGFQKDDARMF